MTSQGTDFNTTGLIFQEAFGKIGWPASHPVAPKLLPSQGAPPAGLSWGHGGWRAVAVPDLAPGLLFPSLCCPEGSPGDPGTFFQGSMAPRGHQGTGINSSGEHGSHQRRGNSMGARGEAPARPLGAKLVLGAKCVPCTSSSFPKSGWLCWVCVFRPKVLTRKAARQSASTSQASISCLFFFDG